MAVPTPISGLPSATPVSGDLAVIVHSGVTSKTTLGDILNLVSFPVTSVAGRTGAITLVSTDISNSTATGRSLLTAADAAAARSAIGAGTGNALTSGTLAQFAATTSAELAGVLTDETGTGGGFVRATGPTLNGTTLTGTTSVGDGSTSTADLDANLSGANDPRIRLGNATISLDPARVGFTQVFTNTLVALGSDIIFGWSGVSQNVTSVQIGFARVDSNTVEINNGTRTASGGALRGLSVSTLTATTSNATPATPFDLVNSLSGNTELRLRNSVTEVRLGVFGTYSQLQGYNSKPLSLNPLGNNVLIGTTADGGTGVLQVAGNAAVTGLLSIGTYTVATLPSASANAGRLAQVTDSNSTTNGNTVAGGGANRVPVFSNGTNWIIK